MGPTSLSTLFPLSVVLLIPLFFLVYQHSLNRRSSSGLPPGPTGRPFIGPLRDIQNRDVPMWILYSNWAKEYGDREEKVISYRVLGKTTVVLGSYKAVNELLERRSGNYSDRPEFHMLIGLMRYGWNMGFMRYSDWWRQHRKTFHRSFQPSVVPEYYDIQREQTVSLMRKLARPSSEGEFFGLVRHHAASIILKIIYGYTLQEDSTNDPYIQMADRTAQGLKQAGVLGNFLVDYLPWLRWVPEWLPGGSFKTKGESWAKNNDALREVPWQWVKKAMDEGTAERSFVTRCLEEIEKDSEEVIKNCAAVAFLGGADTTVSAVLSFILAMTLHPDIQKRAREEVDRVCAGRVPDFSDRYSSGGEDGFATNLTPKMPFVEAVLKEVLRWHPVAPLAAARRSVKDDVYKGYFIPAGSTVIGSAWAVLHDEQLYGSHTERFNPDRFLSKTFQGPPPEDFAFGFGRRVCPGRFLGINTLWIVFVYLLTTLEMCPGEGFEGFDGVEENGKDRFRDGLLSHPYPFKCQFVPRNTGVARMILGL
ncbi:hypothetical protein E1B28_013456 [Marasmius oreades]|uniref:Cytochrome P450 n=1 Tax=Marasmius oreades TaxID=181124 RepID=A0A9P7RPY0_9AGAR|nr:uncharacterized protein E1B28_013456 [Marasmius oreades]KAG7087495.1 hypothetical protein E1B28_013456 [Marasmius oreades]